MVQLSIHSFTPGSGRPGDPVSITGERFTGATAVTFNGVEAGYVVLSDTEISATVPNGATSGPISVRTPEGMVNSDESFEISVPAPKIYSISPSSGPVGTTVRISGSSFYSVQQVAFNNRAAIGPSVSTTAISARVPPGATTGSVTVRTPGGIARSVTPFEVTDMQLVRIERIAAEDANPFETAIIAAWNALFQPGPNNLPDFVSKNYGSLSIQDVDGNDVDKKSLDICYVPNDPYSPVAKSDGSLSLQGMTMSGLGSMSQAGSIVFQDNDTIVKLPVSLGEVTVRGNFNIDQTCCTPTIVGCIGSNHTNTGGGFTYIVPSSTLTIDAQLSTDPTTQLPSVTVAGIEFAYTSTPNVSIPNPLPGWLQWLNYLTGYITTQYALQSTLEGNIHSAIQGSGFAAQVQVILNQEINAISGGNQRS